MYTKINFSHFFGKIFKFFLCFFFFNKIWKIFLRRYANCRKR